MFSFDKQVDFFKKKINLPSETYRDLSNDEHDWAFIVAGATNMNIVADFREAVSKAIIDGTTIEEFRKDFRKIVKKYGWTYNGTEGWRTRIIYDTNLTSSYQAGRYEQLQEVKEYMPYWEYVHTESKHERKAHKELDGTVLPADHEFWNSHYPPNGFNCKCTVHAHNEHTLKKQGKTLLKDKKVEVNKEGVPLSVHPSFNHTPSKNIKELDSRLKITRTEIVAGLLFNRVDNLAPSLASRMLTQLFSHKPAVKLLNKYSNNLFKKTLISKQYRNEWVYSGFLSKEVTDNLEDLATVNIGIRDRDIVHIFRANKHDALPILFIKDLPSRLLDVDFIFKDETHGSVNLIYVFKNATEFGKHCKLHIQPNFKAKLANIRGISEKKDSFNVIRTGAICGEQELEDLLSGMQGKMLYKKKK